MGGRESARDAYDRFAGIYDEVNAQNDYEMWVGGTILPELEKRGLQKGWALDIGCGTGRAFDPLLDRGWQLVGCDVSAGMLAEAERKYGSRVQLLHLDARSVPPVSPLSDSPAREAFQLVLLLNDVVNYMTEDGDLERAFAGVKANLSRDHGLVAFDANTFLLYRHLYAPGVNEEMSARGLEWRGLGDEPKPGGIHEAHLSGREVEPHVHRQRHWRDEEIEAALEANGLRCLATLGMSEEDDRIILSEVPDEERDYKVVYIAAHASAP
ncbi:MAG: class I SAM-dependent DNA methyltransferase [Solirubrobacterales bacterium]